MDIIAPFKTMDDFLTSAYILIKYKDYSHDLLSNAIEKIIGEKLYPEELDLIINRLNASPALHGVNFMKKLQKDLNFQIEKIFKEYSTDIYLCPKTEE